MPLYEYVCDSHRIEQIGKVDGSDAPRHCPVMGPCSFCNGSGDDGAPIIGRCLACSNGKRACGKTLRKVISAPNGNFPGADSWRAN